MDAVVATEKSHFPILAPDPNALNRPIGILTKWKRNSSANDCRCPGFKSLPAIFQIPTAECGMLIRGANFARLPSMILESITWRYRENLQRRFTGDGKCEELRVKHNWANRKIFLLHSKKYSEKV